MLLLSFPKISTFTPTAVALFCHSIHDFVNNRSYYVKGGAKQNGGKSRAARTK
jgi:hypothetical protein